MTKNYKSTEMMSGAMGLWAFIGVIILIGYILAVMGEWYAPGCLLFAQALMIRLWYAGYSTGYQIKKEVEEDEHF